MTKVVNVAWGLCAPMRYADHVAPIIARRGVKVLDWQEYENPGLGTGVKVTVSDAQAAYAEYWLCRSGMFSLVGEMHNPRNADYAIKWQTVPIQRGCNAYSTTGMVGQMPEPGRKRAPRKQTTRRQTRRTRQARRDEGWISKLFGAL